MSSSHL